MSAEDSSQEEKPDEGKKQSLQLSLRAGKDASINIGIDSPAPEKKSGEAEESEKGGEREKEKGDKEKPSPLKSPKTKIALIIAAIVVLVELFAWFCY